MRDRLLQLLAADPALEPRDILVMTPDIDGFAPLVASVFGDVEATGVDLPWRLTDRSQQEGAGLGSTLLLLLELAGARLTATGLETLLGCRPLLERFGLQEREAVRLVTALQEAGFRWGLDGNERRPAGLVPEGADGEDACHSLAWAIDRLLLGLVLPATPGLAPAETAPWEGGVPVELTGRWLHLLGRLRHWLAELRHGGDVRRLGAAAAPSASTICSARRVKPPASDRSCWRRSMPGARRPRAALFRSTPPSWRRCCGKPWGPRAAASATAAAP